MQNGNSGCLLCNDQSQEQNDSSVKAHLYLARKKLDFTWNIMEIFMVKPVFNYFENNFRMSQ